MQFSPHEVAKPCCVNLNELLFLAISRINQLNVFWLLRDKAWAVILILIRFFFVAHSQTRPVPSKLQTLPSFISFFCSFSNAGGGCYGGVATLKTLQCKKWEGWLENREMKKGNWREKIERRNCSSRRRELFFRVWSVFTHLGAILFYSNKSFQA